MRPSAFADKTEANRNMMIQLLEAELQQLTESTTLYSDKETDHQMLMPVTKRGEKNGKCHRCNYFIWLGLLSVIYYLEQKGSLELVMRYLETSQDKVSNLALDIFYRDEKEIKEKKRILTKLRDYFQNDELFTVQESRK